MPELIIHHMHGIQDDIKVRAVKWQAVLQHSRGLHAAFGVVTALHDPCQTHICNLCSPISTQQNVGTCSSASPGTLKHLQELMYTHKQTEARNKSGCQHTFEVKMDGVVRMKIVEGLSHIKGNIFPPATGQTSASVLMPSLAAQFPSSCALCQAGSSITRRPCCMGQSLRQHPTTSMDETSRTSGQLTFCTTGTVSRAGSKPSTSPHPHRTHKSAQGHALQLAVRLLWQPAGQLIIVNMPGRKLTSNMRLPCTTAPRYLHARHQGTSDPPH